MVWWLWPVVGVAIGYLVAFRSGLSTERCVASGLLLGPFMVALLFVAADSPAHKRATCSYCGQKVIRAARVCPHCSAILITGW